MVRAASDVAATKTTPVAAASQHDHSPATVLRSGGADASAVTSPLSLVPGGVLAPVVPLSAAALALGEAAPVALAAAAAAVAAVAPQERDAERDRVERRVERLRDNQGLALQRVAQVQELVARTAAWAGDAAAAAASSAAAAAAAASAGAAGAAAAGNALQQAPDVLAPPLLPAAAAGGSWHLRRRRRLQRRARQQRRRRRHCSKSRCSRLCILCTVNFIYLCLFVLHIVRAPIALCFLVSLTFRGEGRMSLLLYLLVVLFVNMRVKHRLVILIDSRPNPPITSRAYTAVTRKCCRLLSYCQRCLMPLVAVLQLPPFSILSLT